MRAQVIRFALVGALSTVVHVGIAFALIAAGLPPQWANLGAFCGAFGISYGLQTAWTFSSRFSGPQFGRFIAVTLLGAATSFGLSALVAAQGGPPAAGIAAVVLVVPALSFVLHRYWTYRA